MMAIFNSPFGPDVLVVTDRLSEGVDLHRYCRYIVHYELSPSPIRIVQRNGRVRRLGSWASTTNRPIRIVYPAFGETRDQRLVEIMKGRLKRFDLLLGMGPVPRSKATFSTTTNDGNMRFCATAEQAGRTCCGRSCQVIEHVRPQLSAEVPGIDVMRVIMSKEMCRCG